MTAPIRPQMEIDAAAKQIDAIRHGKEGTLNIGVGAVSAGDLLIRSVAKLLNGRKNLKVNVRTGYYTTLMERLHDGELDMVFITLRDDFPLDDVHVQTIADDHYRFTVRKDHPLTNKRNVTIDDVAPYPIIVPGTEQAVIPEWERFLDGADDTGPNIAWRTNSALVAKRALLHGDFIAVLPEQVITDEIKAGTLAQLHAPKLDMTRPFGMITRKNAYRSPAMKALGDILKDEFIQAQAWKGSE